MEAAPQICFIINFKQLNDDFTVGREKGRTL